VSDSCEDIDDETWVPQMSDYLIISPRRFMVYVIGCVHAQETKTDALERPLTPLPVNIV
jgi:hypothetical protein